MIQAVGISLRGHGAVSMWVDLVNTIIQRCGFCVKLGSLIDSRLWQIISNRCHWSRPSYIGVSVSAGTGAVQLRSKFQLGELEKGR